MVVGSCLFSPQQKVSQIQTPIYQFSNQINPNFLPRLLLHWVTVFLQIFCSFTNFFNFLTQIPSGPSSNHHILLPKMSKSFVSTSTSSLFPSLPRTHKLTRPCGKIFRSGGKRSNCSSKENRIVCACSAPPRNLGDSLSSINVNDSDALGNVHADREFKDETDVLIECRNVYKSFGEKHILRGVSFKIGHGEAIGIIGPSGTGKSTILKIMAGLLAPDKGEVFIRGKKRHGLISDDEISGLRIGLVFQSAALFDSLTVRENVGFLLYENSNMSEDQISELVTETLAAVGLKGVENRLPSELSGGMKKRVALARSIIFDNTKKIIEPEVLLYDEPTAGLDPIASTVVEDLIRSVHLKGQDALGKLGKIASYVVVTHQHSTIKRAVDRLLFLYEGKIVWQGQTSEFTTSTNPIVKQFASGSLDGPIKY